MSLPHAILGLLEEEPMTGYDLKTLGFDRTVSHFWSADQAQIYRTLEKLTEQGWVESQIEFQEDHPNRKVYSITDEGQAELRRWLLTVQTLNTIRDPFLVQLYFGASLTNAELLKLVEEQLKLHEERLATYEQICTSRFGKTPATRTQILHRQVLEKGLRMERVYIEYFKDVIAVVEDLKDEPLSRNED